MALFSLLFKKDPVNLSALFTTLDIVFSVFEPFFFLSFLVTVSKRSVVTCLVSHALPMYKDACCVVAFCGN